MAQSGVSRCALPGAQRAGVPRPWRLGGETHVRAGVQMDVRCFWGRRSL